MVGAAATKPQPLGFRLEAWAAWPQDAQQVMGEGLCDAAPPLPPSLRRRITPLGRRALAAAWAVLAGRAQMPHLVLSSRHGEYVRTLALLDALESSGEVSPAEFSLAVHHGLAGLLSIATGNRLAHTAVAAGEDSFGYGCLEAAAQLAEGAERVLLLHFDEPLPAPYDDEVVDGDEPAPLALALLLAPAGGGGCDMALEFLGDSAVAVAEAGGLAPRFLRWLRQPAAVRADLATARTTWSWRRVG